MEIKDNPPRRSKLTLYIIIALFAGILLGYILNKNYLAEENENLQVLDTSLLEANNKIAQTTDSVTLSALTIKRTSIAQERSKVLAARDKKAEPFSLIADIFLRLIKMIVAP